LQARSQELQARSEELQLSNADLEEKAAQLADQKQDIEGKNAEIERARTEIEERARQLALASQYKSQFLANMSHELRTPLNSLLILARLLAQNPGHNLTAKQVEYARVIHSAGSDLLQLINDILDLSKVEAGRMDVHAERFPLAALLEDLRTTFGPLTAEKDLEFTVQADPSAPRELVTDRQRLRQVVGNLLSNAVKFTEQGSVTLRVQASAGTVSFSVIDTGIGIAPENLAVIFGAFHQGDGTLSRRFGGTGLGLSIASEVTALLGGRISAESDIGRGSTFTLYVPATMPDPLATIAPDPVSAMLQGGAPLFAADVAAASRPAPGGASGGSPGEAPGEAAAVLVFEDTSNGLLTLLAHSAISDLADMNGDVRVLTATSAGQGVGMLAAEPFRCVVVDLGLTAALEFLEQVLQKPELIETPVLGHLTGRQDAGVADRIGALRAGYRTLEVLPSLDDLRERITLHLSAARRGQVPALVANTAAAPADQSPGPSLPGLRGKRILVIDDDARNVFAITSTLELHGMLVTVATNGRQGIDALVAAADIDLILMDVMMPGLDGYATMTSIRQMPQFAQLPIIAVTARAMPGDRDKSLTAGASDYVTKPVDTDELLACMERWLPGS
jgi:signal transduction histidine kinase/CheY-like chemotaxis protein